MRKNRGNSSLRRKRRSSNPMQDYDQLPEDLRIWLSGAVLPWRPQSVRKAFSKAMAQTGDRAQAIRHLDRLQARLIARDAAKIWGVEHPQARMLSE